MPEGSDGQDARPPGEQGSDGQDARPPERRRKGWYRRGEKHPPHFDGGQLAQFVTFRLADSMPREKLVLWKERLRSGKLSKVGFHEQIEACLDAGMGACWLRDPVVAQLVQNALLHFDDQRYSLHGWVVMPNHVHVLFTPSASHRLADITQSWKSFTATAANKLLRRSGSFWQDDYFDRYMRDEEEFERTLRYIAYNPVEAALCATPEAWPFSHVSAPGGRASCPSST